MQHAPVGGVQVVVVHVVLLPRYTPLAARQATAVMIEHVKVLSALRVQHAPVSTGGGHSVVPPQLVPLPRYTPLTAAHCASVSSSQ